MPKRTLNVGNLADAEPQFSQYAGETPPAGVYRTKVGRWAISENRNGDDMFKIIFEIAEPKGSPKAKYNGYGIWHNANLTQQGAPYVNQMLDALGIPRKALWTDGFITDPKDDEIVVKIGGKKLAGLEVNVSTKQREYPAGSGDFNLNIRTFAAVPSNTVDDDDDEDEAPADMDEDVSDDPTDYDEDEEPAKAKAAARKRSAVKRKKPEPEPVEVDDDEWDDDEDDEDSY